MKYLKTYEKFDDFIILKIDVSLFPNHKGLKEKEVPTTGTWTTFISANHNKKIIQKCYNILWMKYFNKKDPCRDNNLGPCRPEYNSYPQELVDTLEFFSTEDNVIEFNRSSEKKYWKYSDKSKAPIDKDEIELELKFNSKEDVLYWLDIFEVVLNNINKDNLNNLINKEIENIKIRKNIKKYNL